MQIFPRSLNLLPLVAAVALAVGGGVVTFIVAYYFSYWNTQVGYAPVQPVPFSHRLHAGQLGMDCRYCHANVERSPEAMIPPTQTCMGCHSVVRTESAALAPVRESWETGQPIEWVRVHNLPDHAYFDHSIHLSIGVGCATCHGRIDQMEVVTNQTPLSMSWCLDCHRNPEPNLRPVSEITNMAWEREEGEEIEYARYALPPETCSGCHR
ncbi:cytochrome c3 family protein [Sandaracinus amylolyticus]|uniref:cytochrome c3 family protein n=1 Tax=Sandaracinus amylolyticus TaxID=927083 RepID=UPI001F222636|nr:cytochrome c3 family protein [Sandaracinus amylolyticus]UJR80933.1 Molybdopterin oxidoreductase subunit chaperone protein HtpG [Sandaracinus amylolyticus]